MTIMDKTHTFVPGTEFPWRYKYEHMAVTTDCVIFTYDDWKLKVLLIRRGAEPCKDMWAFPGGFLKTDETAEQGALRELVEETALTPSSPIVQLGVFSDVNRDPRERVITIAFYALVKHADVLGGDDADEAAWFPVDELPQLAFDHEKIFKAAMEKLRRDIHFQPVGFDLLDSYFTIPDLQRLYEAILGVKFDRRNFQRKILASGVLDEVPDIFEEEIEVPEVTKESHMTIREEQAPARPESIKDIERELAKKDFVESKNQAYTEEERLLSKKYEGIFSESMSTSKPRVMTSKPIEDLFTRDIYSVDSSPKKSRPGRKGSWFTFNKKRYEEMKEEEHKLEF